MQSHLSPRPSDIHFYESRMLFETPLEVHGSDKCEVSSEQAAHLREGVEQIIQGMSTSEFLSKYPEEGHRLMLITNPHCLGSCLVEQGEVTVDFRGNQELEQRVSLADVMPAVIREVSVKNADTSKVVQGKREGNLGEFYTDSGERLLIFTGTSVTIVRKSQDEVKTYDDAYIRSTYPDLSTSDEHVSTVRRALEKGVDPAFVLSFMDAGEESEDTEALDKSLKLELFIKELGRQRSAFQYYYPNQSIKLDGSSQYTPEFVAFVYGNLPQKDKINLEDFTKKYWHGISGNFEQRIADFKEEYEDRQKRELAKIEELRSNSWATNIENIDEFMKAMRGQESGGNAGAVNARTGCYGLYQITPKYWDDWAQEAGMPGAKITDPEAQHAVAKFHMLKYFNQFHNWADVASAWYSGRPLDVIIRQGNLNRGYGKGNAEPSIAKYVSSVMGKMEDRVA